MTDGVAYVDGAFVSVDEARLPLLDWGFLHSDATYDVAHVWQGAFFRLDDHLDRFEASVASLRLTLPLSRREMADVLHECVRRSGLRDAYVEMICTRGLPTPGSRDPRTCRNAFYAFAVPFIWIADERQRQRGLDVIIGGQQRIPPASVDPRTKNYHWLDFVMGLFEAYDRGGETVVLTDGAGNVVEGPGFNVFAVVDGTLITPDSGMLEGVTRRTALDLCDELDLPAAIDVLTVDQLMEAEEAFLTSTAGGVVPVRSVDGHRLPECPGPMTARVRRLYWKKHEAGAFTTPVRYDD